MKRWLIVLIVAALALAALIIWRVVQQNAQSAALARQHAARAGAPVMVEYAVAQVRDIVNSYTATGTLQTTHDIIVTPKVTGRILFLEVHEGDIVYPGQVLVRIDPTQIEAQVRQQRAALADAEHRLTQAQVTQHATNLALVAQVHDQQAEVNNDQVAFTQAQQNALAQVTAAQAAVSDAQAKVAVAEAAIANTQAAVNSAHASMINAQASYNRTYTLYQQGYVAAQDVDTARTTLKVAQEALAAAQAQLHSANAARASAVAELHSAEQQVTVARTAGTTAVEAARAKLLEAQAALATAKANLAQGPAYAQNLAALRADVRGARASLANYESQRADTVLQATETGYVTARLQDPGSLATPSQEILEIQSLNPLWITFDVPQQVETTLAVGQLASVTFDNYPGRNFLARIVQVNPSANVQSRLFTVRADIDNSKFLFRPGMFAHATVVTARATHVTVVPREAVLHDALGAYVMVITDALTAQRRAVTTGLSDAKDISIGQGVSPGEKVVTISAYPLRDGQRVRLGANSKRLSNDLTVDGAAWVVSAVIADFQYYHGG